METPPYIYAAAPQHEQSHIQESSSSSSRPTIGFPLGTALLLIVVFSLSGIFSCCYHWDKLRHLRGDHFDDDHHHHHRRHSNDSSSKPKPIFSEKKQEEHGSMPVIMAGDQYARFIAMPCPCEPPRQEKMTMNMEEVQTPPKPPHVAIPMC